jgi:hypothetical protein
VWPYMFYFCTSIGITRPSIRGDVASLPRPVCQPPHLGGGFLAPQMPKEWSLMTFSDNTSAEISPVGDAHAIYFPLIVSIEQATTHEEGVARQQGGTPDHLLSHSIHCPT